MCGICVDVCPMCALVQKNKKIKCDNQCVRCGTCIHACPFLAISLKKK